MIGARDRFGTVSHRAKGIVYAKALLVVRLWLILSEVGVNWGKG